MKLTVYSAQQAVKQFHADLPGMNRIVSKIEARPDVTCRPGCSHCCTILNLVTFGEAIVIAEALTAKYEPPAYTDLRARIGEYIEKHLPAPTPELTRQSHFVKQVPCTMLGEDKRCTIYDVRPSVCRFHYAVSDPAKCALAEDHTPQIVKYLDLDTYKGMAMKAMHDLAPQVPWAVAPLEVVLWWAMLQRQDGSRAFGDMYDGSEYLRGRLNLAAWTEWALKLRTPMIRLDAEGKEVGSSIGTPGLSA